MFYDSNLVIICNLRQANNYEQFNFSKAFDIEILKIK